jgi:hypothetical protein
MKTPFKNMRIYATQVLAKAYPLTLFMARSDLVRQYFLGQIRRILNLIFCEAKGSRNIINLSSGFISL